MDSRPVRVRPNWDACSPKPNGTRKVSPSAIRIPPPMSAPSKPPSSLVAGCIWRPGIEAGAVRQRRSSSAMALSGSAIWSKYIFRVRFRSCIQQKAWMKVHQKRLLDRGKIEKLVTALRSLHHTNAEVAEKIRTEAEYFEKNAERMRYPKFRRQHLFVGSGVIEAGCKTVIGSRLKQSGMFWTVRGANAILALRCAHLNNRFETYWENRRAA